MTSESDLISGLFPEPPTGLDPRVLDPARVPGHVAIIMDGNGRWASARGLSRDEGHKAGVKAVREAIKVSHHIGVRYLTIYSFSTENWNRPIEEVSNLMTLFAKTLIKELSGLEANQVHIIVLGDMGKLPRKTRQVFERAIRETEDNEGMTLALAVNYGSRQEIVQSVQSLARRVEAGEMHPDDIDESMISGGLYTAGMPDPDLVIRTSGEMRFSNFLLWQVAYSEFYVTDVLWPDFDRYEYLRALLAYQGRERRFGGVSDE